MRMKPRWILSLIASFIVTSSAVASPVPDDWGYGVARWNISAASPNLNYYIDPSAASIATTVQSAFSDWAAIPTVYVTLTQVMSAGQANIVVKLLSSISPAGASGVAHTTMDSGGYITACELDISQEYTVTKNTIQHESGHCLGLAHSVVSGAVMSYRDSGQTPTVDDEYALTLLYPKDSSVGYPAGCATISKKPPSATGDSDQEKTAIFSFLSIFGFMMAGFAILSGRRNPGRYAG